MNSIKCAECGLVNFASATECKRCHATLHQPGATSAAVPVVNDPVESDEILSEPIKNDPPQVVLAPLPEYFNAEPAPFTGWVILFAVCLGLSILVFLIQLKVLIDFMGSRGYLLATDQGLAGLGFYNPIVEPLTYAELLLKVAELVAALGVMALLWRKSWAFLRWVRIYLFAAALYQLAEIVGGLILRESFVKKMVIKPTQLAEIEVGVGVLSAAASILISLLWAAYFEKSERVRKIFIN
jgi:hypothetical protein